ncbi:MAG: hypothetical protein IPN01_25290 [Deltaproteobacteria bacterium]|nr:hypothetical protein [Deltaproteobacteria bacterium]
MGPIGARLQVGDAAPVEITADVVEAEGGGRVPRYLSHGVVAALIAQPGGFQVTITGSDGPAELALIPGRDRVWSLHAVGAYRFVHYYPAPQHRREPALGPMGCGWAAADGQPAAVVECPLAVATGLGAPGLWARSALLLGVLLLLGAACAQLIATHGPRCPGPRLGLAWPWPRSPSEPDDRARLHHLPQPLYAAAMVTAARPWQHPGVLAPLGCSPAPSVTPAVGAGPLLGGGRGLEDRQPQADPGLGGSPGRWGSIGRRFAVITGQPGSGWRSSGLRRG